MIASREKLRDLASKSDEIFANILNQQRQLPRTTVLESPYGGRYKVRLYPSEDQARNQEEIIQRICDVVSMPEFAGRIGSYLIFQYLSLDSSSANDPAEEVSRIGSILRNLSSIKPYKDETLDLDREFAGWLNDLALLGFLSPRATEAIVKRYKEQKPDKTIICLDYWDAMSHNFGWQEGTLYLVDEKHIRFSYPGVGLVKPSLLMDKVHFSMLLDGYGESETLRFYRENRPFLILYYLVAALYFYAQRKHDGVANIAVNSRLRYYRASLIRMIWRSPLQRILETLIFTMRFPSAAILAFIRRLTGPLSIGKFWDRFLLDIQGWDENAL